MCGVSAPGGSRSQELGREAPPARPQLPASARRAFLVCQSNSSPFFKSPWAPSQEASFLPCPSGPWLPCALCVPPPSPRSRGLATVGDGRRGGARGREDYARAPLRLGSGCFWAQGRSSKGEERTRPWGPRAGAERPLLPGARAPTAATPGPAGQLPASTAAPGRVEKSLADWALPGNLDSGDPDTPPGQCPR